MLVIQDQVADFIVVKLLQHFVVEYSYFAVMAKYYFITSADYIKTNFNVACCYTSFVIIIVCCTNCWSLITGLLEFQQFIGEKRHQDNFSISWCLFNHRMTCYRMIHYYHELNFHLIHYQNLILNHCLQN